MAAEDWGLGAVSLIADISASAKGRQTGVWPSVNIQRVWWWIRNALGFYYEVARRFKLLSAYLFGNFLRKLNVVWCEK